MNCPQCVPAGEAGLARCPSCGAPLLLREDPELTPLDLDLDLDRRAFAAAQAARSASSRVARLDPRPEPGGQAALALDLAVRPEPAVPVRLAVDAPAPVFAAAVSARPRGLPRSNGPASWSRALLKAAATAPEPGLDGRSSEVGASALDGVAEAARDEVQARPLRAPVVPALTGRRAERGMSRAAASAAAEPAVEPVPGPAVAMAIESEPVVEAAPADPTDRQSAAGPIPGGSGVLPRPSPRLAGRWSSSPLPSQPEAEKVVGATPGAAPGPGAADRPAATPEVRLACAPLERRLAAWAVDAGVLLAVLLPVLLLAALALPAGAPLLDALSFPAAALAGLFAFAYGALALGLTGATLGQHLMGLRVAGPDGRPPGLGRSAARAACAAVGALAFGLGLLPALLGRTGRGVHDHLLKTVVVRAAP